jgi:tRNA pseudouridine55 synthase
VVGETDSTSIELDSVITRDLLEQNPAAAKEALISPEGGILLIDKPYGETSFWVVSQIRKAISSATGIKRVKVGHAGTLDPLATGLLILATRWKTKALADLLGMPKSYKVQMRLGITSPSYDLERPITVHELPGLSKDQIEDAIMSFQGEQLQVPPIFSAIKRDGKPVYLSARKGEETLLEAKPITVHSIELHSVDLPFVTFTVNCSKGTYVRSLVRDIAAKLGTVGVMTELERDSIGLWNITQALSVQESRQLINPR